MKTAAPEKTRKMELDPEGEVLLLDKPLDWTSFDVVKRIRWTFDVSKVGHAGTLDPRATGLLIVCTGKKTKQIDSFMGLEKEYEGSMELGVRTPSFDSETEVTERKPYEAVGREDIERVVNGFVGQQLQTPPMYSAIKHRGKPLYKLARRGKEVERTPKVVDVRGFDILGVESPLVQFRVVCSKGTYVRSLVDDVGTKLGCGATLRSLRRTRIGGFHVRDAMTIEELENARRSPAQSSRVA